jgi:HK97 family phage portal protein
MGLKNWFGRKSNTVIDSPEKLAAYLGAGYSTDSGITITSKNAMQISTVFACIRVLAESIGMLPLALHETVDGSTKKVSGTPLAAMLRNGPNDFMTAQEYKELITVHLCLRGNHYSYKNRVAGRVVELLPLNPSAVEVKVTSEWVVTYKVTFPDGTAKELPQDDVFHVRLFSIDGVNGVNPIEYARNSLGLSRATERHGSKLFTNAAQPVGGFKTDKALQKDQIASLKEQLSEYSGEGAYRNLILSGGMDWFQTTMSSDDAQFLETRKFQRNDICGIFRVPPHMVGDLERATFSNIEHQGLDFVRSSLMPYLTRIESRINKTLVANSNHFAKFNANALLRGDMAARAAFYTQMVQNGALSPNEIRDLEDMNRREGGDIYLTPLNMAINGKPITEETSDAGTTEKTA